MRYSKTRQTIFIFLAIITTISPLGCAKRSLDDDEPCDLYPVYVDQYPAWSPDGSTIAYLAGKEDTTGIYFINPDGTNKRLFLSGLCYYPDWSPDGEWIVFSNGAQIWKIKVTGDSLTQLTFEGRNFYPDWSPDGKKIAYDSNFRNPWGANVIWVMDSDGNNKKDISQHGVGEWRIPDWSPDGAKIVHQRYVETPNGTPEIVVMDKNGNNFIRLTNNLSLDSYPVYSPDGKKIAFSSSPGYRADIPPDIPQIWIMNSDGSGLKKLTEEGGDMPCWSPDGQRIAYVNCNQLNGRIWIMNSDGSEKHQITF